MSTIIRLFILFVILTAPAQGAHFDIDAGRVVLRQLQYCTHCGSALLVSNIVPGVLVRCPDCGHEQNRIDNKYVLSQMYQLCKTCQGPLDPTGHRPGDFTDCDNCHTRQVFDRDAFALAKRPNGPGYAPGYPPGNAEKTLLLAPQKPDTFLSMLPLDERSGDLPLPPGFREELERKKNPQAATSIPQPPEEWDDDDEDYEEDPGEEYEEEYEDPGHTLIITEEKRKRPAQPETGPAAPQPPPRQPVGQQQPVQRQIQQPTQQPVQQPVQKQPVQPPTQRLEPPPPPTRPPAPSPDAIEVPAVTADLFGGKRTAPAAGSARTTAESGGDFVPPGRVLAKVNGEPIHQRDVDRVVEPIMERLRARAGKAEEELIAAREKDLRHEALERLIDRELVVREAAAMGYVPEPAAVRDRENELAQIMTAPGVNLRREAMRDITMMDMRRRFEKTGAANPAAVREFYQKHKDQLILPRRIAFDQLVVYEDRTDRRDRRDSRQIALEIAETLERGARFDDVRDRYDEFLPAAGLERTEPKLLPESAYSRQLLAAAGELRRGGVFGPLFLPGMALFGKVVDDRREGPAPFEDVEKEIRQKLEMEATEKNLNDWLKRLRSKARIEIVG